MQPRSQAFFPFTQLKKEKPWEQAAKSPFHNHLNCSCFCFRTKLSIPVCLNSSEEDPLASEAIENGMRQWSSKTCITFKERADEKAFIYFFVGGRYVSCLMYCGSCIRHLIRLGSEVEIGTSAIRFLGR